MKTALITGANRGIGLELCRQLKEKGFDVFAVCRQPSEKLNRLEVKVIEGIDVDKASDIEKLQKEVGSQKIDWLINNAGIMRSTPIDNVNFEFVKEQFEVNAMAPLRVVLALKKNMPEGAKIGMITSRMGSMGDNTSGGSYGYRMSKAALNAASVSLAHDLKSEEISVAILHPGWVQTDMTNHTGHIDTKTAAAGLIQRIEELTLENSGGFWHSNGERLEW